MGGAVGVGTGVSVGKGVRVGVGVDVTVGSTVTVGCFVGTMDVVGGGDTVAVASAVGVGTADVPTGPVGDGAFESQPTTITAINSPRTTLCRTFYLAVYPLLAVVETQDRCRL